LGWRQGKRVQGAAAGLLVRLVRRQGQLYRDTRPGCKRAGASGRLGTPGALRIATKFQEGI